MPSGFLDSFGTQMNDFASAVMSGTSLHRPAHYAMGELLTALAIYRSAETQSWTDVFPADTEALKADFS